MRETITISIPEEMKKELESLTKEEGMTRSEVVKRSLQDYLFFRNLRRIRLKMMAKAEAQGIFTDEDVFDRVS